MKYIGDYSASKEILKIETKLLDFRLYSLDYDTDADSSIFNDLRDMVTIPVYNHVCSELRDCVAKELRGV